MLERMLDRLQLELVGSTPEELVRCLGEAFEEVALETCSWLADVEFAPSAPPRQPNTVPSPTVHARVGMVLSLRDSQGLPVPRLAIFPSGSIEHVLAWWSPHHGAVCFTRAVPPGSRFTATAALVPLPEALGHLPDGVWSMWREAVASAVIARMCDTPSRPFSSPDRARFEYLKLRRELGKLRIMARQGYSYGGPILQFPTRIGKR